MRRAECDVRSKFDVRRECEVHRECEVRAECEVSATGGVCEPVFRGAGVCGLRGVFERFTVDPCNFNSRIKKRKPAISVAGVAT